MRIENLKTSDLLSHCACRTVHAGVGEQQPGAVASRDRQLHCGTRKNKERAEGEREGDRVVTDDRKTNKPLPKSDYDM